MIHFEQRFFSRMVISVFFMLIIPFCLLSQTLSPVFPETDDRLIFLEGEDAVSTNFNTSATLNYGTSGYKTLQLNNQTWLPGGDLYYTEWVFYVEAEGTYNLWYGGTPPGPREDLLPSYSSPFRVSLDGVIIKECFREDVEVGETYSPSFYWVKTGQMWLSEGIHRLKFEIISPRTADNRFFFFIDNLFLIEDGAEKAGGPEIKPEIFPSLPSGDEVTPPFEDVSHYKELLEKNPDDVDSALELARINTLLGDHIGALRVLRQILPYDVENQDILTLTARNRVWKGDFSQSLSIYRQALEFDPRRESLWLEAGKIAGWAGQYDQSIELFEAGLEHFPDSLNLKVNLALIYLWKSDPLKADEILAAAEGLISSDPNRLLEMGEILRINGYPKRALKIFTHGREFFPEYLDFYFREIDLFMENDELGDPESVYGLIESLFVPSSLLTREVSLYREKQGMKQMVIDEFKKTINDDPDNLGLREALVQAFFWNGMKKQAVDEYRNILVNHTYHKLSDLEFETLHILELIDTFYAAGPVLPLYIKRASELRNRLRNGKNSWLAAVRALERRPEDEELKAVLEEKREEFGTILVQAEIFIEEYDYIVTSHGVLAEEAGFILSEEDEDKKSFSLLIKDLPWEWNREFLIAELEQAMDREKELSPWVLGKVRQYLGYFEEAETAYLKRQGDTARGQSLFGLYETYLWTGNTAKKDQLYGEYSDIIDQYSGFSGGIEKQFESLAPSENEESGYFFGEPEELERYETVLGALNLVPMGIQAGQNDVENLITGLRSVLTEKLERTFFFITQETSGLRFQLGDYLLEMGENREAAYQFEQVLLVDPWNITATYDLGIVKQRYEDWSGAMQNYRKVFYQNPDYENAVVYHNQLGRAHPDTMDFSFVTELDNSLLALKGTGLYSNEINTRVGLDLEYNFRTEHIYRTFGNDENSSFLTQEVILSLPLNFPYLGLKITPSGGGIIWSDYFGQQGSYPETYTVPLSDFFLTVSSKPEYGLAGSWTGGPFSVSGSWEKFIKMESVHPDREITGGNGFSADFSTYFLFPDLTRLAFVSTRTFGELEFLDDSNISGQVLQEGWIKFGLLRNPGLDLRFNLTAVYEDSKDISGGNYYAPEEVLEAKGGIQGILNIHSDDYSNSFEVSLWGSAGGYWEDVFSDEDRSFALKTEGLLSLYFTADTNSSIYASLYGSGNFNEGDFSDTGYWQFNFTLGYKSRMPTLLAE